MLAVSDLIAGRLARPFQAAIPLRNTYWIVCPKATRGLPKIVAFRDWVLEKAAPQSDKRNNRISTCPAVDGQDCGVVGLSSWSEDQSELQSL